MAEPTDAPKDASGTPDFFREEAIEAYRGRGGGGSPLHIAPRWTGPVFALTVAAFLCGLIYVSVGRINEYAEGPALVQASGRTEVTSHTAGSVAEVLVAPGIRVAAGDVLVRLHVAEERARFSRIESEFEGQLVKLLRDPKDEAARQALTGLRAEREQARASLEDRSIRAPDDGTVSDVRVRDGQVLAPGDVVLSLVNEDTEFHVVAMLPGHYRPLLREGMPMRIEMAGFRYQFQEVVVERVSDEIVGPDEVRRRYLGTDIADAVSLSGPIVLVHARLPGRAFEADGRVYHYYDGMLGNAEASVRSEPILLSLVPGLRSLFGRSGG